MRCGQGKAHEEVSGCGKNNCGQLIGQRLHFWGYDLVQLLAGEPCGDLAAALHRADIQGHSGQSTRDDPEGKHQGPKSKDSKAAWSLAGKIVSYVIEHLWFPAARG